MTQAATPISLVRSVVAILGATVILRLLGQSLEAALVKAVANPATLDQYFQARNEPGLLAGVIVSQIAAAVLAGYVAAKIAGIGELAHVAFAALLQSIVFLYEFTVGGNPAMYPLWVQVVMPLVTVPTLLAGAMVRAKARLATTP